MGSESMGDCGAAEVRERRDARYNVRWKLDATQDGHARRYRAGQRLFPRKGSHAQQLWTRKTSKTLGVVLKAESIHQQRQWNPGKKTFLVGPGYVRRQLEGVQICETMRRYIFFQSSPLVPLFINRAVSYSGLFPIFDYISLPLFCLLPRLRLDIQFWLFRILWSIIRPTWPNRDIRKIPC